MNTTHSHQSSPARRSTGARFATLKETLLRRFAAEFAGVLPRAVLRRALDEAELIARDSGFPLLVYPLLAEETVRRVSTFVAPEPEPGPAARVPALAA